MSSLYWISDSEYLQTFYGPHDRFVLFWRQKTTRNKIKKIRVDVNDLQGTSTDVSSVQAAVAAFPPWDEINRSRGERGEGGRGGGVTQTLYG